MNQSRRFLKLLSPGERAACAAVAGLFAITVCGGLLTLFASASSDPWLQPTPDLMQAKAQCDALPARESRSHCTRQLLAAERAKQPERVRLARR